MKDIKSMTLAEIETELSKMGESKYRSKQIFHWLHTGVTSFDEMTNIPKSLRQKMSENFNITVPTVERCQESQTDGTIKYLWSLGDGNCVETVLMRYKHGNTVCISTQVGCRMGCVFCASTIGGKVRDLQPAEMLDQVLFTQLKSGVKINNIVLMGIGEPLDNYDNVIKFLHLVNHPEGMNIGMRHISLSTSGLTEGIRRLAHEGIQITLSVSLHAPDDKTRNELMPVNKSCGIDKLLSVCGEYFELTGRRISYEYAMIKGVNDSTEAAKLLAKRLEGSSGGAHVNLIALNEVSESKLAPSSPEVVKRFKEILEQAGITTTIRRRLGRDIDAACGQLRRKREDQFKGGAEHESLGLD